MGALERATEICSDLADENRLRWNLLTQRAEVCDGGEWYPADHRFHVRLRADLERERKSLSARDAESVTESVAREVRRYSPILGWLDDLPQWDTIARLRRLITYYLAGEGELEALQEAARAWAIGAIHRAVEPGCRLTSMPLCIGNPPVEALEAFVGEDWCDHVGSAVVDGYGLWNCIVNVRGTERDLSHWQRKDAHRSRNFALWGWAPQRPATLADPRYVVYQCWAPPRLGAIADDRKQIWAEALHLYHQGHRPMTLDKRTHDIWGDPWTTPILAVWHEKAKMDRVVRLSDLRAALGLKAASVTARIRINRIVLALTGAKPKKLANGDLRYDLPPPHLR